jgi:hypothetical protein
MLNWPRGCDKIIEAAGVMVPDLNFRSGRRHIRSDDNGGTAGELRKKQGKNIDRISSVPWELTNHSGLKDAESFLSAVPVIEGQICSF